MAQQKSMGTYAFLGRTGNAWHLAGTMKTRFSWILIAALATANAAPAAEPQASNPSANTATIWPRVQSPIPSDPQIEARIAKLLGQLTLEQKVAQMVQPDIRNVTPEQVKTYRLGSILNGGGGWPSANKHAAVADWVALADQYYDASMDTSTGAPAIPIVWGTDAVHGHNNIIGATVFPHNVGLGAAHDPQLIERIGAITAREVAVTGIDWVFAPTVAVVRDNRWGRSYESYSEDPEIVRSYAASLVRGLQGAAGSSKYLDAEHVLATAKHFIGDGGTKWGIDRGDNCSSEQELLQIHAQGYIAAIEAGVQTVMVSYNSWQGTKLHGHRYLITDVLKERMGFTGLVVSDWDGIDEVQGCSKDRCARAVNAGIDLFMVPTDWQAFIANTVAQVRVGDIAASRIDDAVTRILRVKLRAGLFERGRPSSRKLANHRELVGAGGHRAVAREAVRKSLVLLKNSKGLLPLRRRLNVLVAGDGADNMTMQAGGWTVTWQGTDITNTDFPGGTSVFAAIRQTVAASGGTATLSVDGSFDLKPDVAFVAFGEPPYAEWYGDVPSSSLSAPYRSGPAPAPEAGAIGGDCNSPLAIRPYVNKSRGPATVSADAGLIQSFKERGIPVVAVFLAGRPMRITPELQAADAFVVAWLPGSEGGGITDVLFRRANGRVNYDFSGKLAFSWPRNPEDAPNRGDTSVTPLFPYGYGLSYK